jgi:predicted PurR-regulated permease PerM
MTLIIEIALGIVLGFLLLVFGAFLLSKIAELVDSISEGVRTNPRRAAFMTAAIVLLIILFWMGHAWETSHPQH